MKKRGFTLVEIMIVVAIIALLTAIAIPAFLQYRRDARRSLCINNLRLIDHAKEVLAIKNTWTSGYFMGADAVGWSNLDPYIDGTNTLQCPDDTTVPPTYYIFNPIDTMPWCPVGPFAVPAPVLVYTEHTYNPR